MTGFPNCLSPYVFAYLSAPRHYVVCTVILSHWYMRYEVIWQHCIQPSANTLTSSSRGCSLPFQKQHNVFWRRCGFGEWFARRVGSCAFKASLLLLASSNIVVYPTFKTFHKTSERIRISNESQVTKSRTVCPVRFTTAENADLE